MLFPSAVDAVLATLSRVDGTVGEPVTPTPQVRIRDKHGNPVPGVLVEFRLEVGGGSVSPASVRSNERGEAQPDTWLLGESPGLNVLLLVPHGLPEIRVEAMAVAGPPDHAEPLPSELPDGTVGLEIAEDLRVRVFDRFTNPVPNVLVQFSVAAGEGSLERLQDRTDSEGYASAGRWILGTSAGLQQVEAAAASLPPVLFETTAHPASPDQVELENVSVSEGIVGEAIADPAVVLVQDQFGNPVPRVPVTIRVTQGGGQVFPSEGETNTQGRLPIQTWTLGTVAGPQGLTVEVAGVAARTLSVEAAPGPPAIIESASPEQQSAEVGTAVADTPAARVLDQYGNPVPGVVVTFTVVAGGGSVQDAAPQTNADGLATAGPWTLGPTPGTNQLEARIPALDPIVFSAQGTVSTPARLERASAEQQSAEIGTGVPDPPAVQVLDQYGNPVPGVVVTFTVVAGGGSVQDAAPQTNADGLATAGPWTLGPTPGTNQLEARIPGLDPVTFSAEGMIPPGFNLSIEAVHLNQGNQDFAGTIGGVAGRPGLLRVVVRANESNAYSPQVRVRFYQGANLLREEMVPAPQFGVPINPNLNVLSQTWNLPLSAGEVVPGLAVEVEVDPEGTIPVSTRVDNRYPRLEDTASLDVQPIPTLNVVFIPIHLTLRDETGNVNGGNAGAFLEATTQWIPTSAISAAVRPVYSTGLDLTDRSAWSPLLSEIHALRIAEGATDEYYHGIIPAFPGMALGGIAYRPYSPSSSFRTAMTHDRLPGAAGTVAHEIGHNMGRLHSPCGDPPGVDPNYPHPGAIVGHPGWDILAGSLVNSNDYLDYMSYCRPWWTSDYTYRSILDWRRADPLAGEALAAASAFGSGQTTTGLLIWGRIDSRGVVLNPTFTLTARPVLPIAGGSHELKGVGTDGNEIFRFSFEGVEVADGPDPSDRHFAYFVPLSSLQIDAMERVEVSGPRGDAVWISPHEPARVGAPEPPALELSLEAVVENRLQLRWDADRYPMALVRERATGRILTFARDGTALLSAAGLGAAELEILFSDGVRTRLVRPE